MWYIKRVNDDQSYFLFEENKWKKLPKKHTKKWSENIKKFETQKKADEYLYKYVKTDKRTINRTYTTNGIINIQKKRTKLKITYNKGRKNNDK